MDYRLIEFTLGLPESYVYHRGERKHILREAFHGVVPAKILERKDKMGFVSAEELWLKEEGKHWFRDEMMDASQNLAPFINGASSLDMLAKMIDGDLSFSSAPWRILTLNRFIKMLGSKTPS